MDRNRRFSRKRNSIVGDAMAKFEGSAAADRFARRNSTLSAQMRQSVPDIRFDEHGIPISTRQLLARSASLAGSEPRLDNLGQLPANQKRRSIAAGMAPSSGDDKSVRRLSKRFSLADDDLKVNFTVPSNQSRAALLGSNRRWSIKPDWMTKRRKSSIKEEFIEKNLSNIDLEPASPTKRQNSQNSESSDDSKTHSTSQSFDELDLLDENDENFQKAEHVTSDSSADSEASDSEGEFQIPDEGVAEINDANGLRPPPLPLPVEMCIVSDCEEEEEEEDGLLYTQYGKQRFYISNLQHVFKISNGPLKDPKVSVHSFIRSFISLLTLCMLCHIYNGESTCVSCISAIVIAILFSQISE